MQNVRFVLAKRAIWKCAFRSNETMIFGHQDSASKKNIVFFFGASSPTTRKNMRFVEAKRENEKYAFRLCETVTFSRMRLACSMPIARTNVKTRVSPRRNAGQSFPHAHRQGRPREENSACGRRIQSKRAYYYYYDNNYYDYYYYYDVYP